jgi:hypothetical protein
MTEQREPLTREQIIAALAALPTKDAQSIIAQARKADAEQAKERAAQALRQWIRPTRTQSTDQETEE